MRSAQSHLKNYRGSDWEFRLKRTSHTRLSLLMAEVDDSMIIFNSSLLFKSKWTLNVSKRTQNTKLVRFEMKRFSDSKEKDDRVRFEVSRWETFSVLIFGWGRSNTPAEHAFSLRRFTRNIRNSWHWKFSSFFGLELKFLALRFRNSNGAPMGIRCWACLQTSSSHSYTRSLIIVFRRRSLFTNWVSSDPAFDKWRHELTKLSQYDSRKVRIESA